MSSYGDRDAVLAYDDIMDAGRTYPARSLTRLGQAVKALRRERGMTQADLAEAIGVSRQWIIGIEKGAKERAEIGLIMRTLDELDASLLVRDDSQGEGEQ